MALDKIKSYRQMRRPVPGFGHPIHSGIDPRVERLLEISTEAGIDGEYVQAMRLLESCLQEVLNRTLVINVSAAIAAVLGEAGVPASMMRGIVLTARCAGLVGHLFEEMNNPIANDLWVDGRKNIRYQDKSPGSE